MKGFGASSTFTYRVIIISQLAVGSGGWKNTALRAAVVTSIPSTGGSVEWYPAFQGILLGQLIVISTNPGHYKNTKRALIIIDKATRFRKLLLRAKKSDSKWTVKAISTKLGTKMKCSEMGEFCKQTQQNMCTRCQSLFNSTIIIVIHRIW